jgi:hypothetical protein
MYQPEYTDARCPHQAKIEPKFLRELRMEALKRPPGISVREWLNRERAA